MGDKKDPPIEEPGFIGGVKVVDIGDIRVSRGLSRRPFSACRHPKLTYDTHERRIWCRDCETTVEGYDAFVVLVEQYHQAWQSLLDRKKKVEEAEAHSVRSRAAKVVDEAWRKRAMVPACPCCGAGLFPEDFKDGSFASLGRDYAKALRKKHGRPVPEPTG
jgi:hypothetical protein